MKEVEDERCRVCREKVFELTTPRASDDDRRIFDE